MRVGRFALPAFAALLATVALIAAIIIAATRSHDSSSPPQPPQQQSSLLTAAQQQAIVDKLSKMPLKAGLRHTNVCPQPANPLDVCFFGHRPGTIRSALDAGDQANQFLARLGVDSGVPGSCTQVERGPLGSGYACQTLGATWHGDAVVAVVFVSDRKHPGPRGINALVGVLPNTPS
jgi:hypothetical protein